jgi:hypothetical protein
MERAKKSPPAETLMIDRGSGGGEKGCYLALFSLFLMTINFTILFP